MNLSTIKTAVTSKAGRQLLLAQKNSPQLLFAGGIVGVVTGTVLACRATLKADAILADAQGTLKTIKRIENVKYTEDDLKKDQALVYFQTSVKLVKAYAPAVFVLSLSIAALTKSHTIMNQRNAGLMAAYAALEKGYDEYRRRVRDEFGDDKDREFRYGFEACEVVDETEKGQKISVVNRVKPGSPSQYAKFFDEVNPNWSRQAEYNFLFLRSIQNYATDKLLAQGHLFLNEVYDMLGMDHTSAGAVVGWVLSKNGGDNFVDLGIWDGNNPRARDFVNGREGSILLDFNVDGVIYDLI